MELWRYTAELMGVVAGGALAIFGLFEGRWLLAAVSGALVVLALRIIQLRVENRRLRDRDLGRIE